MDGESSIEMTADEREELLGTGGTGVISLSRAADEAPHAIPVSYGYDSQAGTFYFRLTTDKDSDKGELPGRTISFVTYEETEDGWQSVVASGRLERTTESSVASQSLAEMERITIPYVDIFGEPMRDVTFEFFRVDPETVTGRKEA